ncbi:MAG: nicotinamide-nucleotide adenylyltransferase [Archaeoglobus sp.]|nr:MAG: nicotinamide-nucleotide adenylyltransferase [Archaeoglobus sp.]
MAVTRAFFIGRFQPCHLGHMEVFRKILGEVDELIVGVGSAQESHTVENPFTAGERILMVSRALDELLEKMLESGEIDKMKKLYIIPLEDIYRNSLWVSHVMSMVPPFSVVYSNNPLVIRLFREAGVTVRSTKLYRRFEYQGTEIRRKMIEGEDWKNYVPDCVAEVIEEVKGVERIRDIANRDV